MSDKGFGKTPARHVALAALVTAAAVYGAQGPAAGAAVRTGTSAALHGGTGMAADPAKDPGVDPVFSSDGELNRKETYTYRPSEPGDHALPPDTFTLRYDVSQAAQRPLKAQLVKARAELARSTGIALYLTGGTALNDADLTAVQTVGNAESAGGLGLTKLNRLHIYNLRSLEGGTECTPDSGLACAGQIARGGRSPYLWHNGWWGSWVRHLVLDDLQDIKPGSFSNHNFASVSFKAARTVGAMAFGHGPYAKLSVLYLPSVTEIGANAFRRNQYLTKVNLPRVRTIDDFAFDDASRLRYFNAPELESIGRNGLNDSHVLEAVNLPKLRYMGINCFDLNGDAATGTGIKVLRLPSVQTLDKNAIVRLASLKELYAPALTTAWHDSISDNASLTSVYAPSLSKLGPRVFARDPQLRALYLGQKPPVQDPAAFAGTDPAKLIIYYTGGTSAWASFVPAGNPTIKLVKRIADAAPSATPVPSPTTTPSRTTAASPSPTYAPSEAAGLPTGVTRSFRSVGTPDAFIQELRGQARLVTIRDTDPAASRQGAGLRIVPGLADPKGYSFIGPDGRYLRHKHFRLRFDRSDGSSLFKKDTTFYARPGSITGSVTLESLNYPGRVILHRDRQLWLAARQGTAAFRTASSFQPVLPLG
ncbi:AbfB domain-containing protein [Nonomuraea turcica]|uniref:AbfB domain-containing protein n=1 Tax=Nonomuraea sp. G32 TaxID=3067274 RepID=UPI00273C7209|nr:AbfB domain-containing protein [Nonomuraea sp. G32]MDP4507556.1 AbfB domain-containing protein [Nonomuraea sp. G32]